MFHCWCPNLAAAQEAREAKVRGMKELDFWYGEELRCIAFPQGSGRGLEGSTYNPLADEDVGLGLGMGAPMPTASASYASDVSGSASASASGAVSGSGSGSAVEMEEEFDSLNVSLIMAQLKQVHTLYVVCCTL
jgi:hypothetical protein